MCKGWGWAPKESWDRTKIFKEMQGGRNVCPKMTVLTQVQDTYR
jgi:hypothetical protein